ncbi:MAG: peptide synthetase, partial [Actinobacteria bacterium]|nr:peptide synthetase [Actinomycetota bacterium]
MAARPVDVRSAVAAPPPSVGSADPDTIAGILCVVLGEVMQIGQVAADAHFFDDLGADSLVMAHFCARIRKRGDLPPVSMRDIYRHPTIASLAATLANVAPVPATPPTPAPTEAVRPASTAGYLLCGVMQLMCFLVYCYLAALGIGRGYDWISAGSGIASIYLRAVVAGVAGFAAVAVIPIAAKWLLIGRWKPQHFRVWSLAYLRFWIVKALLRFNPCALALVGSPLYSVYLRALGAKVGSGVTILSRRLPVCTDLLTVGDGTVVRKDALFLGYRAHAGMIETGPVTLGRDVFIGERSVLDIRTWMGDCTQLGHASSLHSGQRVPDGERWHGCPAQRTELDYLRVQPVPCGTLRRVGFCAVSLASIFFVILPALETGLDLAVSGAPSLGRMLGASGALAWWGGALALSLVLFIGAVAAGLLVVAVVPRLLNRLVQPERIYPLYGFHDRVQRTIAWLSTRRFFCYLFGDSSYIVNYLSWLGYSLSPVEQTGSNFGIVVAQANPCLSAVGTGTMAADGLTIVNDEISSTSFRVSRVSLGPRNFVGNDVVYP